MKINVNSFALIDALDELNPRMKMQFVDVIFFEGEDTSELPEHGFWEFTREGLRNQFWALKKRHMHFTHAAKAKIIDRVERTGRAVIL